MVKLQTQYAGLSLQSPIIIGSSGLTNSAERNKAYEKAGAGAIVLKSLFEEQMEMQSDALLLETDHPEAYDFIKGYVKANHVETYLELIKESKKACSIPIIASVNCYKADSWIDFASRLQEAGADALELNLLLLDTDIHSNGNETEESYIRILRMIKQVVSIPVTIKLSKYTSNLPALVNKLKANGAAGVVLFNRMYQPDIDINKMQIVLGQLFSSHTDLSDTIRWTAIASGLVKGIDIASSTGVHDWESAIKCLLAGASAVQMCSAIYTHGAEIITQINTCIEEWMHQAGYENLSQFIGKLNYANISDPTLYERCQFMKYLSNRD